MEANFLEALLAGDASTLQELFKSNPSILYSTTNAQKNTALHIAAGLGHGWSVVEISTLCPVLMFISNSKGDTPLHCAARAGHEFVLSFLIGRLRQYESSVDYVNQGVSTEDLIRIGNRVGNTVLHEAVRNRHVRAARELIIADRELVFLVNNMGESPLYLAAERASLEIVELLLQPTYSAVGPNGQNALHAAVCRSYDIAKILLEKRPDLLKEADATRSAPLHYAVSMGDTKMVKLLLDHNTTAAYLSDKDGVSPIHVAASMGHVDIISLILNKCPDAAELTDDNGRNFLHAAVENKRLGVVKYVLKIPRIEEIINEQDHYGNTPIHLAVTSHSKEIVSLFVADGRVDTTARNKKGHTPLDIASSSVDSSIRLRMNKIMVKLAAAGSQFSPQRMDFLTNRLHRNQEEEINRCRALANNLAIVAVLIATVTFAAAFTLPGGYDNNDERGLGTAVFAKTLAFKVFLVADAFAMVSSITVTCLLIYTGSSDHDVRLHSIRSAMKLMCVALGSMVVAFACGVYVVVVSKCQWLAVVICIMVCSFPFISLAMIVWPIFDLMILHMRKRESKATIGGTVFNKVVDFQMPPDMICDFETPHGSRCLA